MIVEAIKKLIVGEDLSLGEAKAVMNQIMEGEANDAQIASFLTALRIKGETATEITGFADVMLNKANRVEVSKKNLVDTCGTGGDASGTFNISTTAAFIAAGAGVTVAKHGNRSISSASGSADILEELGVSISLTPTEIERCIEEVGIGFMFAPVLHPAMKNVMVARRSIGIRTVFNMLGPLVNPAHAKAQIVGVYDEGLTEVFAEVLRGLGSRHVLVVHGEGGLDELSTLGRSRISELKEGTIKNYYIEPEELGIARAELKDIMGGTVRENARTTLKILSGETGPKRDIALLNAAGAILVSGKAKDLAEGLAIAAHSVDSGAAKKKLEMLVNLSKRIGRERCTQSQ